MPAAALIAGRELERLAQSMRPALFYPCFALLLALAMGGFALYYFGPRGHAAVVQQTVSLKRLAGELERRGGLSSPSPTSMRP